MKVYHKKSWQIYKSFYQIVFGNLQIFLTNTKGFWSEEKLLCGRDVERNPEEWDGNLRRKYF